MSRILLRSYTLNLARQERALADATANVQVKAIHLSRAERFEQQAREFEPSQGVRASE